MAFYNSMTAKPKKKKLTGSTNLSGIGFSTTNGSTTQGFGKVLATHPVSLKQITPANMGGLASSVFEGGEL